MKLSKKRAAVYITTALTLIVFGGFIFGVLERTAIFPYLQNTIDSRIQITERIAQRIAERAWRDSVPTVLDVTYMSAGEQMRPGRPEDPERSMGNVFRVHMTFGEVHHMGDNFCSAYVFIDAFTGDILTNEILHTPGEC